MRDRGPSALSARRCADPPPGAGLLWERFQGFVQAADAELRKAGLMRELGVLHGSLHAFVQVQQDLARVGLLRSCRPAC